MRYFYLNPLKQGAARFKKKVKWGEVVYESMAEAARKMRISQSCLSSKVKKNELVHGKKVEILKT